jgi:hypothetical protein
MNRQFQVILFELKSIRSSRFFSLAMVCFSMITISAFLTVFLPHNLCITATKEANDKLPKAIAYLSRQGIKVVPESPDMALRLPYSRDIVARLDINGQNVRLVVASISDLTFLTHLMESAVYEQMKHATDLISLQSQLPKPIVILSEQNSNLLQYEHVAVSSRILTCVWLISAIWGVISWLLTTELYDRLILRYSKLEIVLGKLASVMLLSSIPATTAAMILSIATGGNLHLLLAYAMTAILAIISGSLIGLTMGAIPLTCGGRFRDVAFAGIMGTTMMWLGLVMLAGIVAPTASMFPAIQWIVGWNPLNQVWQINVGLNYVFAGAPFILPSFLPVWLSPLGCITLLILLLKLRDNGIATRFVHADTHS